MTTHQQGSIPATPSLSSRSPKRNLSKYCSAEALEDLPFKFSIPLAFSFSPEACFTLSSFMSYAALSLSSSMYCFSNLRASL